MKELVSHQKLMPLSTDLKLCHAECHGTNLNEVATSACLFYYSRKLLVGNVYGIGLKHR